MCGEQVGAEGHPAGRLGVGVHGDLPLQVHGAGDLQPALGQLQQVRALIHTTHAVVCEFSFACETSQLSHEIET